MTEQRNEPAVSDVPDPAKLEERGVSINAPAPTDFSIPDPWPPSANGLPGSDGQGAPPQGAPPSEGAAPGNPE